MQNNDLTGFDIQALYKTKEINKNWYEQTSKVLGLQIVDLRLNNWDSIKWLPEWGKVENAKDPKTKNKGLVWDRPDGGKSLANFDKEPRSIKLARFALMGEYSRILRTKNFLTFAKVGFPKEWNQCKVLINGEQVEYVIEADLFLGYVTTYSKTNDGNWVMNNETKELKTKNITGEYISIVIDPNSGAFF